MGLVRELCVYEAQALEGTLQEAVSYVGGEAGGDEIVAGTASKEAGVDDWRCCERQRVE